MERGGYLLICWFAVTSYFEVSTTVTIDSAGSLRDTGSVRCGSKVTFVCSIPTYKYTMTWLIDSDKVAECTTTNCVQYPPYTIDNIEFSPDTSNGVFNMTINPVIFKADGRVIKCGDGSDTVHVILAVKVLPKQSTTTISESKDDSLEMINITAMSGCVFPSSALTLQWYYYEAGEALKHYKMSSPTVSVLPVCKSGTCGGDGVVQISSTLSILEVQTGKEYYFQIAIKHEDADSKDIILVNSTRSYKIKPNPSEISKTNVLPVVGIVLGTLAALLVMVILVVVVTVIVKRSLATLSGLGFTSYTSERLSTDTTTNLLVPVNDSADEKNKGSTKLILNETRQASENEPADDQDKPKEEENNEDREDITVTTSEVRVNT